METQRSLESDLLVDQTFKKTNGVCEHDRLIDIIDNLLFNLNNKTDR